MMHSLYALADLPLLAALARERTKATKLDGRACLAIYASSISNIDGSTVYAHELAFMRALGVHPPPPKQP